MTTLFSLERVQRKAVAALPQSEEDRLVAQLRELLPEGAFAFRGSEGVPDIVICWRGAALGLELKGRTESFSEAQSQAFPKLRDAGMRIEAAARWRAVDGIEQQPDAASFERCGEEAADQD